jgi:hypothetical protein
MSMERDVKFRSGSVRLAGTLTLPRGEGPWPGMLLIAGSGQVDRNENAKKLAIDGTTSGGSAPARVTSMTPGSMTTLQMRPLRSRSSSRKKRFSRISPSYWATARAL